MSETEILVVEDEEALRDSLMRVLEKEGYRVTGASSAPAALAVLDSKPFRLVLSDMRMPRMTGVELLKAVKERAPQTEVVLMTAYGTVETAVEAMKSGAFDFVEKPFKRDLLLKAVSQALERQRLLAENSQLKARLQDIQGAGGRDIIGRSPAFLRVMDMVRQVAPSDTTVLILGESGTGKELIARAIHEHSRRASGPMIALNCASLPETLLESELFGHEKGAFTGAVVSKPGKFELADGGSLFLDEIGDMSPTVQAKMLRVLQEGTFERLGGTKSLHADVRIISATNKDLVAGIAERTFREDLYYRLNVITLGLPPLRDRREDLPLLAEHFRNRFATRAGKGVVGFSPEALETIKSYRWPGNVRELENVIERAVILCRGSEITPTDLPANMGVGGAAKAAAGRDGRPSLSFPIGTPIKQVEDQMIRATLDLVKGDKVEAAKLLGIASRTIYRKLEEWEDEAKEPAGDL